MHQRISLNSRRRGTITPLFLMLLVVLFGVFAIAVDYSFLSTTRVELRNTTDATALAPAEVFVDDATLLNDTDIMQHLMAKARASAILYGQLNTVAGQPLALDPNPGNFADGDICFGSIAPLTNLFVQADPSNPQGINAVRIIGWRTQARGNPAGTLASGAFGLSFVDMRASSIALLDHDVAGFFPATSRHLPIAPIAILSDPSGANPGSWEYNVVEGNGPPYDGGRLPTINVTLSSSGGSPNGMVLEIGATATSDIANQVEYGIRPSQLLAFGSFVLDMNNELEVPAATLASSDYSTLATALSNLQVSAAARVYPLYTGTDPLSGEPILSGFVAARVMNVVPISGGVTFTLQPAVIAVPSAVPGVSRPSGSPVLTPYIVKVRLVD